MGITAMACNIKKEFASVALGDERRERRLGILAGQLAASPASSVSGACGGWAESMAAYRLVHNPEVTPDKVLAAHRDATLARAKGSGRLLLVQDTTELDFTGFKAMGGNGPLSCPERRGFFLHSHLLIAENGGVALGICGAQSWSRTDEAHGKRARRKKLPIEEKESMRWMQGYAEACTLAQTFPEQEVIMVADRECDIYEIYTQAQELLEQKVRRADFIIRASSNRALEKGAKLFESVRSAPLLGTYEVEVKHQIQNKKGADGNRHKTVRQARTALLAVRSARVRLRPPKRPDRKLPVLEVTAVIAREIDPPAGEDPVEWILLSSLPVEDFSAARRLLFDYCQRWLIEEFHRVLKTGCRVESLSFSEAACTQVLIALYMVISWRILYLRDLSRCYPELPASCFFSEMEWRVACIIGRIKRERAPPLAELVALIAKMGGYFGRKNDRPPGPEVIWRGLQKLQCYVEALEALSAY